MSKGVGDRVGDRSEGDKSEGVGDMSEGVGDRSEEDGQN
jgi:hypothetical protein